MLKKLTSNDTFLRIAAVLVAVLLWMYVVVENDPQITVPKRGVEVKIVNASGISGLNLKIIEQSDKKIDVEVSGKRSKVNQITKDDITLWIDASGITTAGEYTLPIYSKISSDDVTVKALSSEKTKIYVDQIITVEKNLDVNISGEVLQGFKLGEPVLETKKVVVQGPKSVIETIGSVAVSIDVTGVQKEIAQLSNLELYNLTGGGVDMQYITLDKKAISVKIPVYKLKEVKVVPDADEETLKMYNLSVVPETITVYADADTVDEVDRILTTKLNITNGGNFTAQITVPENIYLDDEITSVEINATLKQTE